MGTQARAIAREVRRAEAAAEQRRRRRGRLLAGAGGVVILGLLLAIVVALVNAAGGSGSGTSEGASPSRTALVTPAASTHDGAIIIGEAAAPVELDIYLDYMCPYCGRFERANTAELERMVADGTVRLELHPLSFLDKASDGARYSTRAANAIATVADRAPDKLRAFNAALFTRQPAEGSRGLSDEEIGAIAGGVGVPPDVVDLFEERMFQPWVETATRAAFASGINGTPTVMINGVVFKGDLYTVGPLTAAVATAKVR